jgi:oxepin-CoA hydrolase/3-oxo-5,6-dehydrosuberyl-CoA semialdehyde dehydrogenase
MAGTPCMVKPATSTSYLTEAAVRLMVPRGSVQLIIGGASDLLDRLNGQDLVTFAGSAETAAKLRANPGLILK